MSRGAGMPTYAILTEIGLIGRGPIQIPSGDHTHELFVPPTGCFQVTNIYVDASGKLVVLYSDIPA